MAFRAGFFCEGGSGMVTLQLANSVLRYTSPEQVGMIGLAIRQLAMQPGVVSVQSPARWCPLCGSQLLGKEQTCSGRCRQKKFRLRHKSRLEPVPTVIQLTIPGIVPETEAQAALGQK